MYKPNKTCQVCNKPFYCRPSRTAYTCSKDCRGISKRKSHSCPNCGVEVLAGQHSVACSKGCSNTLRLKVRKGEITNPYSGKDKALGIASIRKRLIVERGNKCQLCGYHKYDILNVHHVLERHKGGSDEDSNLLLVCPNCHAEIHKNFRIGIMTELEKCMPGKHEPTER